MPPVDLTTVIENSPIPYSTSKNQAAIVQEYDYNKMLFLRLGPCEVLINIGGNYALAESDDTTLPRVLTLEPTITIKEMVNKIRSVFGLNAIQVANLIGISRPSLYNHISEKEKPKSISAYKDIYDLSVAVEQETSGDLKRGLKTVLVNGKTLLAILTTKPLDRKNIISAAKQVDMKLSDLTPETTDLSMLEQRIKSRSITTTG